jgi:hypothetical protein
MAGRVDSGCVAVGRATSGWIGDAHAANIPTNNPIRAMFLMFIVLISLEVCKGGEVE